MESYEELLENGDLYNDSEDREHINNMPELQRETILHKRFMRIQEIQMKKKFKNNEEEKDENSSHAPELVKPKIEDCKCVLKRDQITSNIFKPFISVIKGCFVRAAINNSNTICKIVGIRTVEKYKLPAKVPTMTSIALDVETGPKILQGVHLNYVSSTDVTPEEIDEFINNFGISSFTELNKKYEKTVAELNRSLTDAEITRMIENKLKDNPKKLTNTEKKIQIIAKRDEAIQMKNKDLAAQYQNQLEQIEDEERLERRKKLESERGAKKSFIK